MPADVLRNPLVSALLGILVEGPAHPYRLHLELKRRRLASSGKVSRGTLYNVIRAMEKQGWVDAGAADTEGNRPERVPYSLTVAGFEELRRCVEEQIRKPVWSPDGFFHSISHIGVLGRTGARDALRERSAHLKEQNERDAIAHANALAEGAPRLFVIEAEYLLHNRRAELRWVERIADEIETGDLKWPKRKR